MSRAMFSLSFLALTSCSLLGGANPCRSTCDFYVDCTTEILEDYGIDCAWDDDDEAKAGCIEVCDEEFAKRDGSEKREIRDCLDCVFAELDGDCGADDYYDAIYDECEDLCDDNDVEDFLDDLGEEFGDEVGDELECDYDSPYDYDSSTTYYYK